MLGIRWARPEKIQGTLKSFKITTEMNGVEIKSFIVEPTPCIIWPDLFCYSITSLRPNKLYKISVSKLLIYVVPEIIMTDKFYYSFPISLVVVVF